MLVVRLAGVWIEGGVGQFINVRVMHGEEDLAGLDGGGEVSLCSDGCAAGGDADQLVFPDAQAGGVFRMDFQITVFRVKFFQDLGFGSSGLCVPLAAGAAPG